MYWLYWLFILILLVAAAGAALLAYRTYVMGETGPPNFNLGAGCFGPSLSRAWALSSRPPSTRVAGWC